MNFRYLDAQFGEGGCGVIGRFHFGTARFLMLVVSTGSILAPGSRKSVLQISVKQMTGHLAYHPRFKGVDNQIGRPAYLYNFPVA